jgi:NAD(P)-dependent dehydrogenase (short-subunit alcohol dehydrogenase family)
MTARAGGAVFVTGASGGIGFATSRALAERGFRVFGSHLPAEDAEPLRGIGVSPLALDVTDVSSVEAARDRIAAALGDVPLVGLVNNAGIADGGPIEMADLDAVRRMLEVNVFGLFAVTKAFLPALRAARGRVVNVSSVSGQFAAPFLGAYCACKFALEAFSDSLRREMLPFGVDVIVVRPAITRTAIWDRASALDLERFRGSGYEAVAVKVRQRMLKSSRKGLDPAQVAGAIVRALTEAKPPTRIAVLRKGKLRKYLLSGWLPDRMVDRVVAQKIWD